MKVGFSEFSRECATLWKAMSPEQRVGYQQLAEHDKVRYRNEIDRYRGRVSNVTGVKKRGRKKKQPGEPKRNMCAFLFFCSEKRPQLKAQNPNASVGLLAKQLAGAWKIMTDEQKRPYGIMAERDKERYDQQKAAYSAGYQASKLQQELSTNFNPTTSAPLTIPSIPGMPSLPQISQQVTIPATGSSSSTSMPTRGRKKKDPNMPKRCMSGFMFFSIEKRPHLRLQNPKANVGTLSKQLAAVWNTMTPPQKEPYEEMARRDKERYERELLEYRAGHFDPTTIVTEPGHLDTVGTSGVEVDLHPDPVDVVTVSVSQTLSVPSVTQSQDTDTAENFYQYMYQPTIPRTVD